MTFSQFNEDDIIDSLLDSPHVGTIVDIGAGDGMEISNSRLFRERGWYTVLAESSPKYREALRKLQSDLWLQSVTPKNINKIVPLETEVLSIDVDGDDIFLLEALEVRPTVIVIEHNPTIPYYLDVMPARLGLHIGASVAALSRVAEAKGYGLVAVTHCNAIFRYGIQSMEIPPYYPAYAVATEYFSGRPLVLGTAPWGLDLDDPYPIEDVVER